MAAATMVIKVGLACLLLVAMAAKVDCKSSVTIRNGLPPGQLLYTHCQSGDTNFDPELLSPGQEQHWEFHTNVWERTLYFCHFQWGPTKTVTFTVWKVKQFPAPCGQCLWEARVDGFYEWDKYINQMVFVYAWNTV